MLIPIGAAVIYTQGKNAANQLNYQSLKLISTLTREAQRKYSAEVLKKISHLEKIKVGRDHGNQADMIPTPATFAIELSAAVSNENLSVRMFSSHPFRGREDTATPRNAIERQALDALVAGEPEFIYQDARRYMLALPVAMSSQACVDCHNGHPDSQFRDWKVGDVRSVLATEVKVPFSSLSYLYPIFFIVLSIAIATPIILLIKLSRLDYFKQQAITDALTGIYNRKYINSHLKDMFNNALKRRRDRSGIALLMLDLDHFKKINDEHGHARGDECLKAVVEIIGSILVRETDIVARYGGEEFVIYLGQTNFQDAQLLAEKIRAAIEASAVSSANFQVTVSLGLCFIEHDAGSANFQQAFELADSALYEAKNNGRNRVVATKYS